MRLVTLFRKRAEIRFMDIKPLTEMPMHNFMVTAALLMSTTKWT